MDKYNNKTSEKFSSPLHRQAWKPKNKVVTSLTCPHCGNPISKGDAICLHCGKSLIPEKCSFCGAPMKENAKFCVKCGQSRDGVVCPECGTVNSRNFCRKCNSPLTPLAVKALEAAKSDPKFKALQKKADELAELHAQIEELRQSGGEEKPVELSDADKSLLDEYADILGMIGAKPIDSLKNTTIAPEPQIATRKQYSITTTSIDDLLKAYKEKAAEMNEALAALTPPPDFTPEQQRDYYSARKIATVTIESTCDMSGYNPTQWRCNYCSNLHDTPSDCARPELGGVWEYISVEEYVSTHAKDIKTSLKIE